MDWLKIKFNELGIDNVPMDDFGDKLEVLITTGLLAGWNVEFSHSKTFCRDCIMFVIRGRIHFSQINILILYNSDDWSFDKVKSVWSTENPKFNRYLRQKFGIYFEANEPQGIDKMLEVFHDALPKIDLF